MSLSKNYVDTKQPTGFSRFRIICPSTGTMGQNGLMKLCAALLRSFKGQHSEKMKGSARGNWDPWEGQQPFRPNPNRAGDRTSTMRRPLIGAVNNGSSSLLTSFWSLINRKKFQFGLFFLIRV